MKDVIGSGSRPNAAHNRVGFVSLIGGNTPTKSNKRSRRGGESKNQTLPELNEWPEIPIKDISSVTTGILEKIQNSDVDGIFEVPVLETYPDLESAYLAIVKSPMDLRTIEEERVHEYESIKELQKDLILMFKNCCIFNETGSDLWIYAS